MVKKPKTKSKPSGSNQHAPRIAIAILAAGKGTRLKSKHPKVLHEIGGKPILAHVIATAQKVVPAQDIFVIIGHEAERVREAVAGTSVNFVLQSAQRGTGHALMVAREALFGSASGNGKTGKYDQVIVLSGDAPLITAETIRKLSAFHSAQKATMTLLTADLDDPYGYGRDARALYEDIDRLSTENAHGEYYLTDMAAVFHRARKKVVAIKTVDASEVLGTNTRAEVMVLDARRSRATGRAA